MVKSESFPIFMWLPFTEFTDHSEKVFSIDNRWVFSYKSSLYHHTRVKFWRPLSRIFENEWQRQFNVILGMEQISYDSYKHFL